MIDQTSNSNSPSETFDGGCTCGAVRFRLQSAPMYVHCCHCTWCQRETGAAFALNALIETDRLTLLKGEPTMISTPTISGEPQNIFRCPECEIALWSHYFTAVGDRVCFVRIGTLDEAPRFAPDIHIFTDTKQPWLNLAGNVPVLPEFYAREELWPAAALARFKALED